MFNMYILEWSEIVQYLTVISGSVIYIHSASVLYFSGLHLVYH